MKNNNFIYIPYTNIIKEFEHIKKEILLLKEKINILEQTKTNNYLVKDDDYHIL